MYQMYDRGLVRSLDDPLSTYCPRFSMLNPFDSRNITLRQIAAQVMGCAIYSVLALSQAFLWPGLCIR